MEHILVTNSLTKKYRHHKAVDGVNMHVGRGAIYGLIGRNGAGKTTLLKMISGLAGPTDGEFSLFGQTGKKTTPLFSRIGTLIESPGIFGNMDATENLRLKAIALGVRKKNHVEELLELVGLSHTGNKRVKNFSLGMKQRLGIALAMVGEPDMVILDEPINGLDPHGIAEIRETLCRLNAEKQITFIISSHILEELSKIATHYGIIHNGVLLQELTRKELHDKCSERIELTVDDTSKACTILEAMDFRHFKVVSNDTIHIFERLDDTGEIAVALSCQGVKTIGIVVKNEALEDYFLNLTGGERNV